MSHKKIKSLTPCELLEVITGGISPELIEECEEHMSHRYGSWRGWPDPSSAVLSTLTIYLSDTGFSWATSKEKAERLRDEFKSWNVFYEVWSKWHSGSSYKVGFRYDYAAFNMLYEIHSRNKKIDKLLRP